MDLRVLPVLWLLDGLASGERIPALSGLLGTAWHARTWSLGQEGRKSEKLPVASGCKGEPGTLPSQIWLRARGFEAAWGGSPRQSRCLRRGMADACATPRHQHGCLREALQMPRATLPINSRYVRALLVVAVRPVAGTRNCAYNPATVGNGDGGWHRVKPLGPTADPIDRPRR